jgi:hypothetical protein
MFFKKKNIKRNIKRNKKLLSFFYNDEVSEINRNVYLLLRNSIKSFVFDSFKNNIIFFAIEMDMCLSKRHINTSVKESLFSCKFHVEDFLEKIELLEFAYLTRKKNKYYLLIGIKGLLGYSDSIFNNLYIILLRSFYYTSNVDLIYLKSKKKVLRFFNFLVEDFNFKESYCFKGNFVNKKLGGILFNSLFSTDKEISFFKELYGYDIYYINLSLKLNVLDLISKARSYKYFFYYNKVYQKEHLLYDAENPKELIAASDMVYKETILFYKNDFKIISRKIEDEQSIINLWLIYMKANNLYVKNLEIYEKKESGEISYIGNLDFLKYNISEIIIYIKEYFSFQLSGYPIENLILKYLELAYEKILSNPYYYLPYLEEKLLRELIDNYIKLYEKMNDLEVREVSYLYTLESDKESEREYEESLKSSEW